MEPKDNALQASFNKKLEDDKKAAATTEEVAVPEVKGPEESVKSRNELESTLSSSQRGRNLLNRYDNNTSAYAEQLRQSNEKLKQAGMSYTEYVDGIMNEVKRQAEEQRKQNEAEAKRDSRLQLFGSITEAAANLANVIAVSKGASVATWKSQQNTWAERAAAARRERDAKLQRLDDQLKTLDQQKSQMRLQLDKENAARDAQLAQLTSGRDDNRAKLAMDIASQLRSEEAAKDKLALEREKFNAEEDLKRKDADTRAKKVEYDYLIDKKRNDINDKLADARIKEAEKKSDKNSQKLTPDKLKGARDKVARHSGFSDYNEYLSDYSWYSNLSNRQKRKATGKDRERIDRIERLGDEAQKFLKEMRDFSNISQQTIDNWGMSDYFNEAMQNDGKSQSPAAGRRADGSSGVRRPPLQPDEKLGYAWQDFMWQPGQGAQQEASSGSLFDELMGN